MRGAKLPSLPGQFRRRFVSGPSGPFLDARFASNNGDPKTATASWRKGVEIQDRLAYDEPPTWYYPVRESLGGELLKAGNASEAEKVFRTDLEKNPQNGRSLLGLYESLKRQKRTAEADWMSREFQAAWKNATVKLRVSDL